MTAVSHPVSVLMSSKSFSPLVKICGIKQLEQAVAISELGADLLGLNFWPGSKRHLPPTEATVWRDAIPANTRLVGLFVNASADEVLHTARSAALDLVQLHGDESPEFCQQLQDRGLRIIKAFQVRDESSLDAIAAYPVKDILLDAYHPGQRGGIGQTFPWELAVSFRHQHPDRTLWLAGGLTPLNVGDAVRGVSPDVIDVAGGVESGTPGIKDLNKVRDLIHAVRDSSSPAIKDA